MVNKFPVNHFGVGNPAVIVATSSQSTPRIPSIPKTLNTWIPVTAAKYGILGTNRKVYATWAFQQIDYSNRANEKRLRSVRALLSINLKRFVAQTYLDATYVSVDPGQSRASISSGQFPRYYVILPIRRVVRRLTSLG